MPRLPIAARGAGLVVLALLACPAFATEPFAPVTTLPDNELAMRTLERHKSVIRASRIYDAQAQTAMLYYRCPQQFSVDDAKRMASDRALRDQGEKLRAAYHTLYTSMTGKQPPRPLQQAVVARVGERQRDAALVMDRIIQSERRGCDHPPLSRFDTLRMPAAPAPMPANSAVKPLPAP